PRPCPRPCPRLPAPSPAPVARALTVCCSWDPPHVPPPPRGFARAPLLAHIARPAPRRNRRRCPALRRIRLLSRFPRPPPPMPPPEVGEEEEALRSSRPYAAPPHATGGG
ncbi:unnamed protein product, partial [Urochloa humidicola]